MGRFEVHTYVRLQAQDFDGVEGGRIFMVLPAGDNARWCLRELKKAGGKRPATRWPDAVWFTYTRENLALVRDMVKRIMRVEATFAGMTSRELDDDTLTGLMADCGEENGQDEM